MIGFQDPASLFGLNPSLQRRRTADWGIKASWGNRGSGRASGEIG